MSNNHTNGDAAPPTSLEAVKVRKDGEDGRSLTIRPLMRSPIRALVQDFEPLMFTWCMNTGIIAILLHQHPYQFEGIRTLGTIAFVINIVLFVAFSIIFLARFAIFRAEAFYEITNDISQLPLLACWAIGYLTLPPCVSLFVSQAYWGGYWATVLAYVMWWIGAAFEMTILAFVFIIMARRHLAGGSENTHKIPVPPLVIIPAVGVATAAVTGAEIVSYSSHMNERLAVPIIICAFLMLGLAMTLATFLYAILWRQLLETGFPPPQIVTSMFMWVGPFGQSAAALQGLGTGAQAWFRLYNEGSFLTASSASVLNTACVLGALLLVGPATFFTLLAVYAVIDTAISTRKVKWTPAWNAVIFPVATLTTATTYLSIELNSPAFKVLTSIQLIILVAMWFVNLGFTLFNVAQGKLLIVREDPRVKKQLEDEHKER